MNKEKLEKIWRDSHRFEIQAKENDTITAIKQWNRCFGQFHPSVNFLGSTKGRGDCVFFTADKTHPGFEPICLLALSFGAVIVGESYVGNNFCTIIRTYNNYAEGGYNVRYHRWATDKPVELVA